MMTMTTNNTTIAAMKYIFFRRIEWSDFARMCQIGPRVGLVIWLSIEQSCIRIMGHCVLRWLTYKVMSRDHFLRRPLRCNQTTFLDGATFSKKRGFFLSDFNERCFLDISVAVKNSIWFFKGVSGNRLRSSVEISDRFFCSTFCALLVFASETSHQKDIPHAFLRYLNFFSSLDLMSQKNIAHATVV